MRGSPLPAGFGAGYGAASPQGAPEREAAELAALYQRLSQRRLEALGVARTMNVEDVDASAIEAFEPEELQHVS